MPARIGLSILNVVHQVLVSLLLHSSLHSDITVLVVEFFIDFIVFTTLCNTRNRLVTLYFGRVLRTTVGEQGVIHILVHFSCAYS